MVCGRARWAARDDALAGREDRRRDVWRDGVLVAEVGRSTAANIVARPNVTWAFPGSSGEEFSLIVDGDASIVGEVVEVRATWAVLHRPAIRPG